MSELTKIFVKNKTHNKTLSILMMSYNQGSFIDDAIESVVKQNLPFNWELLIGDDNSTDGTIGKSKKWVEKYPNNIFFISNKENIGLHKNYINLILSSSGKYIALLEADDYWIDNSKCLKQIELMESNPKINWTFTNGIIVQKNKLVKKIEFNIPEKFDLSYFLSNKLIPLNNSIVFRADSEPKEYPLFFLKIIQWDMVLMYLRSLKGLIGYVPINGVAWRRHENATSFSQNFSSSKRYEDWLIINKEIKKKLPTQLHKYFNTNYIAYEFLAIFNLKKNKYLLFIKYLILMFLSKPLRKIMDYRNLLWKIKNAHKT